MPTLQETDMMVSDWDTWEKSLDPAKRQQLDSMFRFETDKTAARQRFAAVAHVSAATGADIEDVSRRFETWYMPAFAADEKIGLGKVEGVKDAGEFYGLLQGRAQNNRARLELFDGAADAALQSVLKDGDGMADFAAWQAGQDHEDAYGDGAIAAWKKAREEAQAKLGADGLAIAKRGVRAMRKETGVADEKDAWWNEARRDLIRVKATDPAKYNLILAAMKVMGENAPRDKKGAVEGMVEQAGRVLGDMATGAADFGTNVMRDASATLADAGITNAEDPAGLAAQIRAGRDVDMDLEDLMKGVIDPIRTEREGRAGWIEQAAYNLSSSAPIMLAARNPMGQTALVGMFADESYNDFRKAGWSGPTAAGAAVVSGLFQTGVEYVSELAIKIPGVAGVMAKVGARPGSSWAAQFMLRSLGRGVTELGEEAVQQATNPFIQELGAAITKAIPDRPEGQKLKDVMAQFMETDNLVPLVLSILPLGMLGAGVSTTQDMAVIDAVTRDNRLLRAVFSEEDAAAISAETDPAARLAMIQEKWVATPIPEIVERAQVVMKEQTAMVTDARQELERLAESPYFLIPKVKRDENGWMVQFKGAESESVVRVASKEAAVSLAYDGYEENVRAEGRAMVDTLEAFSGAKDIFEVDLANELLLKDTGISEEEMTKAAIAEGIINGMTREEAEATTWVVHGQNRLERVEGVRRVVSSLARGANVLDAVEEPIEGKFMAALKSGRLKRDQAIAWVKMAAGVMNAPELVTAAESGERGLIEAVSDVVLADVFGKRKDGSKAAQGAVSAGIRAKIRRGEAGKAETQFGQILASFRHFFGQVFKRARQLVKARKDGRIGEDFDAFLDVLMETDVSQVYEAESAREAVEMAGEIDNAPFSLAPRPAQEQKRLVHNALQQVVDGAKEGIAIGLRPDLASLGGSPDVSLPWGDDKMGLSKIGNRRGIDVLRQVLEAVAFGSVERYSEAKKTVVLAHEAGRAVLSLDEHGQQKTWLLTGWEEARPDASGEVSAQSGATQTDPTFSRDSLGAGLKEIFSSQSAFVKGESGSFSLAPRPTGYLGAVSETGSAQIKAADLATDTHESQGLDPRNDGRGTFRYRKDNETLYWHFSPDEMQKEAAIAALERKGFKVKRSMVIVFGSEDSLLAHGLERGLERGAFSLAPRSLASVADTILASKMKKPEFREVFYALAREKMSRLRSDGEWKVSKFGVASRRTGTDTLASGDRSTKNIENERKFRFRSRQRELLESGMNDLSPNQMMSLERGAEKWEDRPRLAGIFADGKLMSKTTATKLGKYDPKQHGDYDAAPGWLPPAMYGKGDSGTMPDVMAQRAFDNGLIPEPTPDALWEVVKAEMDTLVKGNEEARSAQRAVREVEQKAAKQAREESEAWAKGQKAKVPTPKQKQLAALRTLDAILSAFPAEIRGQVGGFVKLASLGTDKAREAEIVKRLEKLDKVVEKAAKKHYLDAIEKVFDKAKPTKGKAGEKPKGKLGANAQALVDLARKFSELDESGVAKERAGIAELLQKTTDPGKLADLAEREQLLDLFGDLDERTSAELEAAAAWLADTYQTGRNRWRAVIEQREAETKARREAAVVEIGKGSVSGRQSKKKLEAGKESIGKFGAQSFDQVLSAILGRGSQMAKQIIQQARDATTRKTDSLNIKRREYAAMMASVFGTQKRTEWMRKLHGLSKIGGVKVTIMEGAGMEKREVAADAVERIINGTATAKAFGLDSLTMGKLADAWADNEALPANRQKKNLTFEVPHKGTADSVELSELQAVHVTMLARQAGYTENMAGHGWTAEVLDEIEKQLSTEAKAIRDWLAEEYRTGYDSLNEVYARMYGVNLPRLTDYAPGTFEAMDMMNQDMDPYGQGLLAEGGFKANMTKSRGKHTAEPRLEDALSVYWGHVGAVEHFKAFAEFSRDLRAVMNNAKVRASISAKGGAEMLEAAQRWMTAFEQNGLQEKASRFFLARWLSKFARNNSYVALAYNFGTLMKQSTAALGSLLKMSPTDATRQFSRLVSGQLDLKASYNSATIQRRMESGYSPEVRQAMAGMMAQAPTAASPFLWWGMDTIGRVDALFTTASHAMAWDFHFREAKESGMNEAQARAIADQQADLTVSQTAQPSEMMDRSIFELESSPEKSLLFMFASEARQKFALALEAYTPSSGLSKGERATRLMLLHIVFPMAIQTVTNIWRDARDDDDEDVFDDENWRARDYAIAAAMGPLMGFPIIGDALEAVFYPYRGGQALPVGDVAGGALRAAKGISEGDFEGAWKGTVKTLRGAAILFGGDTAAAAAVGARVASDVKGLFENVEGTE